MEIGQFTGNAVGNGNEETPRQATPTERRLHQRQLSELDSPGSVPDRCNYQFKIIDYGLANFEETYACGPDIVSDEVGICEYAGLAWLSQSLSSTVAGSAKGSWR